MIRERVAEELQLVKDSSRKLCLSLSGGVDSSVLFDVLKNLQKIYEFQFQALHLNYGLRGEASEADEAFCRRLCDQNQVPLSIKRYRLQGGTAIQERARSLRLGASLDLDQEVEIIEAHHADDQIETFFMRLMRGASFQGLASMRPSTLRNGRRLWRPLLGVSKAEIISYARLHQIVYREDASNRQSLYDRNFLRNEIFPLMAKRFPHFRRSVMRTIETIRDEDHRRESSYQKIYESVLMGHEPLRIDASLLASLSSAERCDFLHRFLKRNFQLTLSKEQTDELSTLMTRGLRFAFNAPKGIIVRGQVRQGRLEMEFCSAESPFQRLGVTNERLALY